MDSKTSKLHNLTNIFNVNTKIIYDFDKISKNPLNKENIIKHVLSGNIELNNIYEILPDPLLKLVKTKIKNDKEWLKYVKENNYDVKYLEKNLSRTKDSNNFNFFIKSKIKRDFSYYENGDINFHNLLKLGKNMIFILPYKILI